MGRYNSLKIIYISLTLSFPQTRLYRLITRNMISTDIHYYLEQKNFPDICHLGLVRTVFFSLFTENDMQM